MVLTIYAVSALALLRVLEVFAAFRILLNILVVPSILFRSICLAPPAEEQKCTSSQAIDVFGVTVGDGQHLMIGHDEAKRVQLPLLSYTRLLRR
jgi:hypothetical protein